MKKEDEKWFINNNRVHLYILYTLICLSFLLHLITLAVYLENNEQVLRRVKREAATEGEGDRNKEGANVEFIHPKLRDEMTANEAEDPDNPWVWLTSYSRIPLEAIQDFCAATKEYCPPGKEGKKGDIGMVGIPGEKGKRGRPGRPGSKGTSGHRGAIGPPGPRGPKGEFGKTGLGGLDGRDGLPGEPGLDGIPGRNGLDGLAGIDGIPGTPGTPGLPGTDGENGSKGGIGPRGPIGIRGDRGLTGPRGRPGKNGQDGLPGKAGITTWAVEGSTPENILIPPAISGNIGPDRSDKPIIVQEGDNLKLSCAATGNPRPMVSWNRMDGMAIPNGAWRTSNPIGSVLNITHINRKHMGNYRCEANNGISPVASQIFYVNVYFPPLIRIHSQMVGGYNGSSTVLECMIEAFPAAVNYWERHDGRIIEYYRNKYDVISNDRDQYVTILRLNLTLTKPEDFGTYYCISKNEKGITKGAITIYERDPNSSLPPPVIGGFSPVVIGEEPPEFIGLEDLCPSMKEKCPECTNYPGLRCEGSAKIYGLNILPYLPHLPGLPNRTQDCVLETIGKPVFHRYSNDYYGSWLMDAVERPGEFNDKIWVTKSEYNSTLFEYVNKTMFSKDISTRNYTLPLPFTGNDHVIYNGSFYYLYRTMRNESIIKYDLLTLHAKALGIPKNPVTKQLGVPYIMDNLYSPAHKDNYLDLNTDENGIWGIFGLYLDNSTIVMKMDSELKLQYMWNISLNHHLVADMFIVCGVLYAVDNIDTKDTNIEFALDLYRNKILDVELPFTNPFKYTTMLGYNPRFQSLTTWDAGNQLTYPIKYIDIGYPDNNNNNNEPDDTGFTIQSNRDSGLQIVDLPKNGED